MSAATACKMPHTGPSSRHHPVPTPLHNHHLHQLSVPVAIPSAPCNTPLPTSSPSSYDYSCFDCGIYLFIGQIFPRNSFAIHLPGLLRSLVMNPIITFAIVLVIYPLLSLLIFPFFLMSYLVTCYGSWLIFFLLFISLIRYFAICMIFPGSLPSMERKVANDYLRGMANQFDKIGVSASNIASSLVHASTRINTNITINTSDLYTLSARSLPILIAVIKEGIQFLLNDQKERLSPSLVDMTSLGSSLESLQGDLMTLHSQLIPLSTSSPVVSLNNLISDQSTNNADLVNFGMKCGANAHSIRIKSQSLKVVRKDTSQSLVNQIRSALSNATDFWKGPQGLEKSALPMIRKHISLQYLSPIAGVPSTGVLLQHALISDLLPTFHSRVCRFGIIGNDNNLIDGIFIGHSSLSLSTIQALYSRMNNHISSPPNPILLPTVLFCPPNAGLYECLVMAQSNSSWLGYYLNQGMNFVVFNYRGYGASSGSPDPTKLQMDGLTVAKYLQDELGIKNLLVHGESVGGLVACHIARYFPLKGLIIDRSFTSLDAVSRRMLGNWAGTGLQLFGQWKTDSLENYLRSSCPYKIILQDPDDEIVYHTSSLKVGIASYLLLGDNGFGPVPSIHRDYKICEYLGSPLICPGKFRQEIANIVHFYLPSSPLEPDTPLTFYHRSILSSTSPSPSLHSRDSYPLSEAFIEYFAACVINVAKHASRAETLRKKRVVTSPPSSPSVSSRNTLENYLFQDNLESEDMEESDLENLNQRSDLYQPRSNKWKQMEEFCSRNLQDSQYSLVEKVWLILSRTDGECGQLLGQAVIDQYDGIRAWVVSYILWGAFSVRSSSSSTQYNNSSLSNLPRDVTLPPSRSDITRTIAELKYSLSQSLNQPVPFPSSDSSTPSISVTAAPSPLPSSHHAITGEDDEGDGGDGVNDSSHYYFILLALEIFQLKQQEIKNRNYECLQSLSLPWPVGEGPPIGKLITVHSGHNGWPNHHELEQFTAFLSEISFQSDSR